MRAVHGFLKRAEGVQTLQNAAHNPDAVGTLERHTRQSALTPSAERARQKDLQRSREGYRSQLRELGWHGGDDADAVDRGLRASRATRAPADATSNDDGAVLAAAAAAAAQAPAAPQPRRGSVLPRSSLMPSPGAAAALAAAVTAPDEPRRPAPWRSPGVAARSRRS